MPITSIVILMTQRGLLERVRQFFHENGEDRTIVNSTDQNGWTALHHAAFQNRVEIARLLIEQGSSVDATIQTSEKDDGNASPLHLACRGGATEMMRELLQRGANLHARDATGRTPFVYACEWGQLKIVQELMQQMREHGVDAADNEKNDVTHCLLATVSNDGSTPLHWTGYMRGCRFRDMFGARESSPHSKVAAFLLEYLRNCRQQKNGENESNNMACWINAVNSKGDTALHVACRHGSPSVVKELLRNPSIVTRLQNKRGETALHLACWKTHLTIVQDLLQHNKNENSNVRQTLPGANFLNLTNHEDGESALHYASRSGRVSVVNALLRQPTLNVNAGSKPFNDTALHAACRVGNFAVVQALLSNAPSLNVNALNAKGETAVMVTAGVASSVNASSQARRRSTDILLILVLHIVSLQGCVVTQNDDRMQSTSGDPTTGRNRKRSRQQQQQATQTPITKRRIGIHSQSSR
mmetsp:Transcript_2803/g.7858  ORF Transcript_2803/g.7858 Transcript_2803/m.7858 type:complete len:471 (+) Transcript_2803:132-1544(+)